jgi:thioesterase domain-containing protein
MADEYIDGIKAVQPKGPYVIGGECLGGSVAHAIALKLIEGGDIVSSLLLLDTPRNRFGDEIAERLHNFIHDIKGAIMDLRESLSHPRSGRASPRAALETTLARCLPVTRDLRERRRLELGPRKYANMLLRYRPERYVGRVLLIVNEEWNARRPSLGWDAAICPRLDVRIVPGDHSTRLNRESAALERCLRENLE